MSEGELVLPKAQDIERKIMSVQEVIKGMEQKAGDLVVDTPQRASTATDWIKQGRDIAHAIEVERTSFTDPLNQVLKGINARYKPVIERIKAVLEVINKKLTTYQVEQQRRADEERRRLQAIEDAKHKEEKKEARESGLIAPVKQEVIIETKPIMGRITQSTVQTRATWTFREKDFLKVPDPFKMLNEPEIRQAIRNGVREIPGLEIYQEIKAVVK